MICQLRIALCCLLFLGDVLQDVGSSQESSGLESSNLAVVR